MSTDQKTILILGNYRQSLALIRSLAKRGYSIVLGVSARASAYAEYSRYVRDIWPYPEDSSNNQVFIDALEDYLTRHPEITDLFPVGEHALQVIQPVYARLSQRVSIAMVAPEVVAQCLDKPRLFQAVNKLDVPLADFTLVNSFVELSQAAEVMGYPVIVKPTNSRIRICDKKAVICKNPQALSRYFDPWPEREVELIVQKYIAGPRHNVYFCALDGRIIQSLEVNVLRTDALDGTGLAVAGQTIHNTPIISEYCQKIVAHLNYTGIGCLQFIVNPNQIGFLELNPRLGANFAITYYAGMDLPAMAVDIANHKGLIEHNLQPLKIGVRYAWTLGDLAALKRSVIKRELNVGAIAVWLSKSAVTFVRSPAHITWSWRDPLPTLLLATKLFPSLLRRLMPKKILQSFLRYSLAAKEKVSKQAWQSSAQR